MAAIGQPLAFRILIQRIRGNNSKEKGVMKSKSSEDVGKLLEQMKSHGAVISPAGAPGEKVADNVLRDLKNNAADEFEAWITWTKSF